MTKVITTTTAPVAVSPLARIARSAVQAVIGFGAAEPVLIGGLGLTSAQASRVAGITASVVFIATALQNFLEHKGWWPTIGAKPTAPTTAALTVTANGG